MATSTTIVYYCKSTAMSTVSQSPVHGLAMVMAECVIIVRPFANNFFPIGAEENCCNFANRVENTPLRPNQAFVQEAHILVLSQIGTVQRKRVALKRLYAPMHSHFFPLVLKRTAATLQIEQRTRHYVRIRHLFKKQTYWFCHKQGLFKGRELL